MVLSAIFILDLKGKTLIARNFRGDVPMNAIDRFMPLVSLTEAEAEAKDDDSSELPPLLSDSNGVHYLYTKFNNIYFVALTRCNSNAATIFVFLQKLIEVFSEYFKEVEEESIRDNFVIIYELLDEMIDFGYPQTTEPKILREYITQESHKLEVNTRPPLAVTNAVSWRSEGIKYRKNEVFLDVIESVNLLASPTGAVLNSEILGAIKMRCYLSGMPELRLGLNDKGLLDTGTANAAVAAAAAAAAAASSTSSATAAAAAIAAAAAVSASAGKTTRGRAVEMEDVKFHQCVRLARFENDRTISFIPPDGEFELMSYRLNTQVRPLIICDVVIESFSETRIEYMIKAKAQFKRRSCANNVEIMIPVPCDADSPKFKSSCGSVSYKPEESAILWKIKQISGGSEALMRAHFGLPSVRTTDFDKKKPPISIKFEIPYFTISGLQVRYLKVVEKCGYQALPWVRYISQNGCYQMRMPDPIKSGNRIMQSL